MIIIRGRIATYGALWFDEEIPSRPEVDILLLSNRSSIASSRHCRPFLTLVNDLTISEERLFAAFSRRNQYEIKRAGARDAIEYRLMIEPSPHLHAFCDFYDSFAATKSIAPIYRKQVFTACAAGKLVLSTASHNGAPIVWHAYIRGGTRVMLLQSASHFRSTDDHAARTRIARANRWAHWQDMLRFKAMGVRCFDWGGLFSNEGLPEHAGVNRFKRQFGGQSQQNYDCKVPITLRGHLALTVNRYSTIWSDGKRRLKALNGRRRGAWAES